MVIRTLLIVAEVALFAFLLLADFGLAASFSDVMTDAEFVVTAMTTLAVAAVVAVLALCRTVLSVAAVASAFIVSAAASMTSAAIGSPTLSLTEIAALGIITVFAIRYASPRGAVIIAGAGLVVALEIALLRIGVEVTPALLAVLAWGCAVAAGIAARSLQWRRTSAMESARLAERMELARELHDIVAHQVTGIVVQAQAAIVVAQSNPDHAGRALAAIETAGTEALSGMRRMVGALRETDQADTVALTVASGIDDIEALVDRFDPSGDQVLLSMAADMPMFPAGVGETAYRVVREALTNVRRHAHASSSVAVALRSTDSQLEITVRNDGVRFRPDRGSAQSGFGLAGMEERVTALGGSLTAGPDEPDAWVLTVVLPTGALH